MVLRDKFAGKLQRVTFPLCNLSRNFFGLETIVKSRVMLHVHGVFSLQFVSQRGTKESIESCRGHVTRNFGLKLAMVSKQSLQSLQKVELRSTLLRKVARQVAHCSLSATCLAKPLQHKL